MAGLRSEAATALDLVYLRNPWVPAFAIRLAAPTTADRLRCAIADAGVTHPRLMARYESGFWVVRGTADDIAVTVDDDVDALAAQVVDVAFGAEEPVSVRAGLSDAGRLVLLAWRHGACDASGGVAFASRMLFALDRDVAAFAPPPDTTAVVAAMRRAGRAPNVWRAVAAKLVERGGRNGRPGGNSGGNSGGNPGGNSGGDPSARADDAVAQFPMTGPPALANATASQVIDAAQRKAIAALARRTGASFTGWCAAALAATTADLLPGGGAVQMFLPVNLRPPESRWAPDGNWVGNVEVGFARPPTPVEATAAVRDATNSPMRQVALAAAALRRRVPGLERQAPDAAFGRSIVLNNLGAVSAAEWPGALDAAFYGPSGTDMPAVTLFSVDDRLTVCVRVRRHQGGDTLAPAIRDGFVARLCTGT